MNQERKRQYFAALIAFFALSGFASALRILFFRLAEINLLTYEVRIAPDCFSYKWCFLAGLPAVLLLHSGVKPSMAWKTASALAPFLMGFLLPQGNFLFFPLFLLMLGWGAVRLIRVCGGFLSRRFYREDSDPLRLIYPWILLIVYVLTVGWGYYLQLQSSRSLFLAYPDWGIYAENGIQLISGNAGWKAWLSSGSHWNPLANVIIALWVWMCPFEEAFFLFNSMLIYSVIPLTWIFARKIRLLPLHSFLLAMAAAFCPVYGNLSLCVYYGFRPIYFAIPLLLLFFLFQQIRSRIGMAVCFICTLMLKETMMIFWFGYGLWLLFKRKWISGAVSACGSLAGFFVLSSFVLPKLVNAREYPLTFLYATLGDSPKEVMMSPWLKPEVFWSTCLQYQNFLFIAVLLILFFLCVWLFPDRMIIVLPLLGGICLRGAPEVKNLACWYGVEAATLFLALSLINLDRIRQGEKSLWCRMIWSGLPHRCPRVLMLTALAGATLLVSVAAHYCFALTLWGKYSFRGIRKLPDWTETIDVIKTKLPPGSRVLASGRLRNHFMFEHPTAEISCPRQPGDCIVLSLHDRVLDGAGKLEDIRRQIAADPKIIPVDSFALANKHIVLFRVTDGTEKSPIPPMQVIPSEVFRRIGSPVPSADPDFKIRYIYRNDRHVFLVRIENVPAYDIDFCCVLSYPDRKETCIVPFGWGLYPAYSCPAGTVFMVEKPGPPASRIQIYCAERKESRFKR